MKYKSFDHMNCSLAQTLEAIGERWTLLILRDVFFGARRFNQFERNLGVSKNILTARLNRLVDEGILEKCRTPERAHLEYRLTAKGLDLQPVLLSMTHWGDKHKPPQDDSERVVFVERASGEPIQTMTVRSADGRALLPKEVIATPIQLSS